LAIESFQASAEALQMSYEISRTEVDQNVIVVKEQSIKRIEDSSVEKLRGTSLSKNRKTLKSSHSTT
jgi:hypothetical protein